MKKERMFMPEYLRQQLQIREDTANIGFFYSLVFVVAMSVAVWALRRGERVSLAAELRQRSISYDNFTTISVFDSLLIVGAVCIGIWALVALTIFGT